MFDPVAQANMSAGGVGRARTEYFPTARICYCTALPLCSLRVFTPWLWHPPSCMEARAYMLHGAQGRGRKWEALSAPVPRTFSTPPLPVKKASCPFGNTVYFIVHLWLFFFFLLPLWPCACWFVLIFVPSFTSVRRRAHSGFVSFWVYTKVTNIGF